MTRNTLTLLLCIALSCMGCKTTGSRAASSTPAPRLFPENAPEWILHPPSGVVGYSKNIPGASKEILEEVALADAQAKLSSQRYISVATATTGTTTVRQGEAEKKFHTRSSHTSTGLIRGIVKQAWSDPATGDLYLLVDEQ